MCRRFTQTSSPTHYAELLGTANNLEFAPRYNVAPSQDILACKIAPWGERILEPMHWGLVPSWAKEKKIGNHMINARAETVAEKPAFRHAFRAQRCLIPADGFYEWNQTDGKQPYYIHRKDDEPMVFAGLWEHWDGPNGEHMDSCTIIVCDANEALKPVHERMPVILPPKSWEEWLRTEMQSLPSLLGLLVPYRGNDMEVYPVSKEVNNPRNEGEALIQPVS